MVDPRGVPTPKKQRRPTLPLNFHTHVLHVPQAGIEKMEVCGGNLGCSCPRQNSWPPMTGACVLCTGFRLQLQFAGGYLGLFREPTCKPKKFAEQSHCSPRSGTWHGGCGTRGARIGSLAPPEATELEPKVPRITCGVSKNCLMCRNRCWFPPQK